MKTLSRFSLAALLGSLLLGFATSCSTGPVRNELEDARGCWVQVYSDQKYSGDNDIIIGPRRIMDLKSTSAVQGRDQDWNNRIQSLIVGPSARVYLWRDKHQRDTRVEFAPNSTIPDLRPFRMSGEAESLEVVYEPALAVVPPVPTPPSSPAPVPVPRGRARSR